ncbi:MAG: ABC-F family ATP-binding cassette domain-containing protein [Thermodesulfobacteriota bacterium]|nr:ABC-F family ATP-binding cassette domain-containing protein [Thermodesulfobacteriota bacterium]
MIKAVNLSKSYGAQVLFDDIGFDVNAGERVGLVGRNGHGKTTLFRLIIGREQPDAGEIAIPKGYRIGYVTQHVAFSAPTVLEECCLGLPEQEKADTWRAEKVLAGLGFSNDDMQQSPDGFSGGYQVRLNLAKVICSAPDMLLLDEPTNYLDIIAIRWLSAFLNQWRGELILITHDRSFMDGVITHTLGIHRKKLRKIPGATDKYYSQIMKEEEIHEKTRLNEEKKRRDAEQFITRFRAKARLAGMVQSRIKALEKQEKTDKLDQIKTLDFSFNYSPVKAKTLLQVKDLGFAYEKGAPIVENVSFTVGANDRICVIGKNGRGKSTLLKLLAGELTPDTGERKWHPLVQTGYFAQTNKVALNENLTVEDEIINAGCEKQRARNICGAMMFEGDQALKRIGVLSGGEKNRVLLGKILAAPANVLLLDEPTNHLDMESCDAFLDAVEAFPGAVIIVTHNEMFLHTLANRLIVFQSDGICGFDGNYQDFLDKVGWEEERKPEGDAGDTPKPSGASKKALRKRRADVVARRSAAIGPLKKTIVDVEQRIEILEAEAEKLNRDMVTASEAGDGDKIAGLSRQHHETQSAIETLYDELDTLWQELETLTEQFDSELKDIDTAS